MGKNYRAPWHDYKSRCIYHLTLAKSSEQPPFGTLAGDYRIPVGRPGSSYILSSPLGNAVKDALRSLPTLHPALKVFQYALMPDHLHLILFVEADLDEILGRKIGRFKDMVNKRAGASGVFAEGFNDQIITKDRSLDAIYSYLRSNPYRLAVRRAFPDFFQRRNNLLVGSVPCQAYGNIHLLDNPFKSRVIVHRADSPEKFEQTRQQWLHSAANGGVLVSPFISPREKDIRTQAEELAARLIVVTNEPFAERQKPSAHDFSLCTEGRLLIIAPQAPLDFSRQTCLQLNTLAQSISANDFKFL